MSVEQIAKQVLSEHGILKGVRIEETPNSKPCFEAFTGLQDGQTTFKYNPDFALPRGAKKFAQKKQVSKPLETCARDIISHECGHIHNRKRKECPGTVEKHEEHFYEPTAKVLPEKKHGTLDSITNLQEDLIENTLQTIQDPHAGLSLFYKDVANTTGWEPVYEAYMRIQTYCWADTQDKELFTKHFTNNPEVTKATQTFLRKLEKLNKKKERLSKQEITAYFSDEKNWKTIATEFTKALEPLIPEQLNIPMCGFGKQMQKAMRDPSNRDKFARKNYSTGQKKPSWMEKEEALDAVYSSLAREIQVKVDAPRKAASMPIVPFQHEPFNPEQHSLTEINFKKPMIIPEKETPLGLEALTFGVPEHYIERPLLVKKGITSFPEFKCAYIDASGTMQQGIPDPASPGNTVFIPWGDTSKYHYLCKAWYGIIEYLARQQILPNIEITLGAFSNTSKVKHGLEDSKKLLFNPQFGETNMDTKALNELFSGGKSVFFTISDGDIHNWDAIKDEFISKAKEHYYFHIQIGPSTQATKDLKKAKLPVYHVDTGEDLERMAIDLTRNAYQSYISETMERLR